MKLGIKVGARQLLVVLAVDLLLPAPSSTPEDLRKMDELGIQSGTDSIQLTEFNAFQTAVSHRTSAAPGRESLLSQR